jgi:integrase
MTDVEAYGRTVVTEKRRTKLDKPNSQNIYERPDGTLEVVYRDEQGRQRWRTIDGGITAARAFRDEMKSRKNRGVAVADSKVRFGPAADAWLAGPVASLREGTQRTYADNIRLHLKPAFESARLDRITPDMLAKFVRDKEAEGLSGHMLVGVLGAVNRVYRYASRSLGYNGRNPVGLMLPSERPKAKSKSKRKIYDVDQLQQVIEASRRLAEGKRYSAPWPVVFLVSAVTGARVAEVIGLAWQDMHLGTDPTISFRYQLDAKGNRVFLKTDGSERVIPIPDELAAELLKHQRASLHAEPGHFVFASRSGTALTKRNTSRALRAAQVAARDREGNPTFPILHEKEVGLDGKSRPKKIPRGVIPGMHSFRHTYASRAFAEGQDIDEVAFLLGHRDGTVTRQVYIQEVSDTRREAARRARISESYGNLLVTNGSANEKQSV